MTSDHNFHALGDADLGKMATAAPRRLPQRGAADLGGRLRVASILRKLGIEELPSVERIAGTTNEVWRAAPYIVRVGFVPGADRLRREAKIAEVLPDIVHYPKVIAAGQEDFGEWLVVRNVAAGALSADWQSLSTYERRDVVLDIAEALRAVHEVKLPADRWEELAFHDDDGALALPHQLDHKRLQVMLDEASRLPFVDASLVADVRTRLDEVVGAFDDANLYLIHGDLHFGNVLSLDGVYVGLLDFEWSRLSRREVDLEVLGRYCAEPELHVGGSPSPADYRDVLRWMNEGYPDLFSAPRLAERLTYCALGFDIPALLDWPPDGPASQLSAHHPLNRLRQLLERGSAAERLGWEIF